MSWTHLRSLIYIDDPLKREFYLEMCRSESWSTRTLQCRLDSMLFERTALSRKPRQEVVDAWSQKAGRDASRSACDLLDEAGIPYVLEFASGEVADTIVRHAQHYQCDIIVMGTRGMGMVANLVLGSVATKVMHLANIPVTLVK